MTELEKELREAADRCDELMLRREGLGKHRYGDKQFAARLRRRADLVARMGASPECEGGWGWRVFIDLTGPLPETRTDTDLQRTCQAT